MGTIYTVIGYFISNNQPWSEKVEANEPQEAAMKGVKAIHKRNEGEVGMYEIVVVEVIAGHHEGCLDGDCTLLGSDLITNRKG